MSDVATQEILELANDADPHGDRTLGVLTKPDLVDKGAEPRVIDLVDGRTRPMKLAINSRGFDVCFKLLAEECQLGFLSETRVSFKRGTVNA